MVKRMQTGLLFSLNCCARSAQLLLRGHAIPALGNAADSLSPELLWMPGLSVSFMRADVVLILIPLGIEGQVVCMARSR